MAGRFKLDGRTYEMTAINEISLRDLVLFNAQAAEMGGDFRWSDVEEAAAEMQAMKTVGEASKHPRRNLVIAVTIWISRRAAGDDLSFGEAIDFPMSSVEFLPSAEDRKPGPTKARKGPAKKSTRKASARAGGRPGATRSTTPKT